jgi:phytoene synthase
MYTIYAFFRHIDDIVDGDLPDKQKIVLLKAWREELDNIYDKKVPTTNIGRKIYKNCMRFKLPKSEFVKMLDSISMDLPTPIQAPDMENFNLYCRGVAGVPGNLTLRIFGCDDENLIERLSTSLGRALQITNILRDVKEDAQAQRIYIPQEMLEHAGILSRDPFTVLVDKNLAIAREQLSQIAEADYKYSFELIKKMPKKTVRQIRMIACIYRRYFDLMKNRGWEIISPKPKIGKLNKLYLIIRAFFGK